MNEAIWNLLHDGLIVNIEGEIPGDIILTVEIKYLRKMFSDDGENIIVKLYGCDFFQYRKDVGEIIIKGLDSINENQVEILSGDLKDGEFTIFCQHMMYEREKSGSGQLKLRYKDFSIFLDNGKQVLLDELDQKAEQYWDNFEKRK